MYKALRAGALLAAVIAAAAVGQPMEIPEGIGLKDIYANRFEFVGTAYQWRVNGLTNQEYRNLVLREFNSLTHEDHLKPYNTMVQAGSTDDDIQVVLNNQARGILQIAEDNSLGVRGHAMVWHQQTDPWFFRADMQSNTNTLATPEQMNRRMRSYIHNILALIKREFPNLNLYAYDVVNEVFLDNGSPREPEHGFNSRDSHNSMWVAIYGDNRFVDSAFVYAAAARDIHFPNMKLFYNDFNEYHRQGKTDAIVALANRLGHGSGGLGVMDGIGMQSHLATGWPSTTSGGEYREALQKFAATGLEIHVTELDITIDNVTLNPGPTDAQLEAQATKYREVFESLLWAMDTHDANITSVTFWGATDDRSWRGPTASAQEQNFPLLFNADFSRKPAYYAIAELIPSNEWGGSLTGYALIANASSGGRILRTPAKARYEEGETVTLRASANLGYVFVEWSGDIGAAVATDTMITITMDGDKTVSAAFALGTGQNLLRDGNFPVGSISDEENTSWRLGMGEHWGNSAATFEFVDGGIRVNVTANGANPWEPQVIQRGVPLYNGTTYLLTFTASASAARDIVVQFGGQSDPWPTYGQDTIPLTMGDEEYSFEFTMEYPTDEIAQLAFNLGMGPAPSTVTISNASLTVQSRIARRSPTVRNASDMRVTARRNGVNVRFRAQESGVTELRLYTLNGRMISRTNVTTVAGRNYTHRFNAGRLSSGVYVVAVQNGRTVQRSRVTVR